MIHTASLVHDDVLDECDTRRGASSRPVHSRWRGFVSARLARCPRKAHLGLARAWVGSARDTLAAFPGVDSNVHHDPTALPPERNCAT